MLEYKMMVFNIMETQRN